MRAQSVTHSVNASGLIEDDEIAIVDFLGRQRAAKQVEVDLWRAATVRPPEVKGARNWH